MAEVSHLDRAEYAYKKLVANWHQWQDFKPLTMDQTIKRDKHLSTFTELGLQFKEAQAAYAAALSKFAIVATDKTMTNVVGTWSRLFRFITTVEENYK